MQTAENVLTATAYSLPPMRGIKQAIDEIRASDPNTKITEWSLRRMVVEGVIPSVKVGNKYLINMNVLIEYLTKGTASEPKQEKFRGYGQIRPVRG